MLVFVLDVGGKSDKSDWSDIVGLVGLFRLLGLVRLVGLVGLVGHCRINRTNQTSQTGQRLSGKSEKNALELQRGSKFHGERPQVATRHQRVAEFCSLVFRYQLCTGDASLGTSLVQEVHNCAS